MIRWMIQSRQLRRLAFLFFTTRITVSAQDLTEPQVALINARLVENARESWELGTWTETILERSATRYSVFSKQSLPPPSKPDVPTLAALRPIFGIVNRILLGSRSRDPQPMIRSGSAADPASLVVAVCITNLTKDAHHGNLDYARAAKSQIDYLFKEVPKTKDGALSHLVGRLQLWSDSVYMVPPSLAYYGVVTRDLDMVREAHKQIRLYRESLLDPAKKMWKHIAFGNDPGCWSTGNGWAAAGILRVYATIKNSEYASALQPELRDLGNWVQEIHTGMYATLSKSNSHIFANYADRPLDSGGNFPDAAATALLASTVYRAARLLGQTQFVPLADKSRLALSAPNAHLTPNGILFPVVNPMNVGVQLGRNKVSPEAQAFAVQMHQAWKDWKQ